MTGDVLDTNKYSTYQIIAWKKIFKADTKIQLQSYILNNKNNLSHFILAPCQIPPNNAVICNFI